MLIACAVLYQILLRVPVRRLAGAEAHCEGPGGDVGRSSFVLAAQACADLDLNTAGTQAAA